MHHKLTQNFETFEIYSWKSTFIRDLLAPKPNGNIFICEVEVDILLSANFD